MNRTVPISLAILTLGLALPEIQAQDVELLGRTYGTRPPDAYFRQLRENPTAFRFSRGWRNRTGAPLRVDGEGAAARAAMRTPLGQRENPVTGTLAFPLVLGLYADSPGSPYSQTVIQQHFFDGPNPTGTIPDFYSEVSGGRVSLVGVSFPWQRSTLTAGAVAGGVGGLSTPGKVGAFIVDVLGMLDDGSVDWGQFDNDGPDGVPDSGDDDGYVDVLTVMHPTAGAECNGDLDRVWSHRWQLRFAAGSEYETETPSSSTVPGAPPYIRINDYTIQPAASCSPGQINEIGVFAHELGHGFGLPDLYDTFGGDGQHGAAGRWSLMATGSWGCAGGNPARPCHMDAWSKSVLGWVEVETLAPGADHGVLTLSPVETGGPVYRVDGPDGSNEYFLLEHRARAGFDQELMGEGLLVWHIDQDVLDARWAGNSVNVDAEHMGVWLRAADGLNQGAQDGDHRGDGGDVFPGTTGNSVFHASSAPAALSHGDGPSGLTLLDITRIAETLEFRALTRFQTLTIQAGGTGGVPVSVIVDGGLPQATELRFPSAPFQQHLIEAGAGSLIDEGIRAGFVAWEDGSPRIRQYTTGLEDAVLVANYGGEREMLVDVAMSSPAEGVDPGQLDFSPPSVDGWYDEGAQVMVTAMARTGFAFREWGGDLAGSPNPAPLLIDRPMTATAEFDVTFAAGTPPTVPIEAARAVQVTLLVENANLPVQWSREAGPLPHGLDLTAAGVIRGTALDAGSFPLQLRVVDAIGLEASAAVTLEVAVPNVGTSALTAPFFGPGVGPTPSQIEFLDRHGNANGGYDLGDLRSFVLANPDLPAQAGPAPVPTPARVVVPLTFQPRGRP